VGVWIGAANTTQKQIIIIFSCKFIRKHSPTTINLLTCATSPPQFTSVTSATATSVTDSHSGLRSDGLPFIWQPSSATVSYQHPCCRGRAGSDTRWWTGSQSCARSNIRLRSQDRAVSSLMKMWSMTTTMLTQALQSLLLESAVLLLAACYTNTVVAIIATFVIPRTYTRLGDRYFQLQDHGCRTAFRPTYDSLTSPFSSSATVPPGVKDVFVWLTETPAPRDFLLVVCYASVLTYLLTYNGN